LPKYWSTFFRTIAGSLYCNSSSYLSIYYIIKLDYIISYIRWLSSGFTPASNSACSAFTSISISRSICINPQHNPTSLHFDLKAYRIQIPKTPATKVEIPYKVTLSIIYYMLRN
jgi:hypothetical protein